MPFDPNKPFQVVGEQAEFDPSQPFQDVEEPANASTFQKVRGLARDVLNVGFTPDSTLPRIENAPDVESPLLNAGLRAIPGIGGALETITNPAVVAGVYNATKAVPESMASPFGIGTMALGAAGKVSNLAKAGASAMGLGFTGLMTKEAIEGALNAKDVFNNPESTKQQKIEAALNPLVQGTMAGLGMLGVKHEIQTIRSVLPKVERTMKAQTPEQANKLANEIISPAAPPDILPGQPERNLGVFQPVEPKENVQLQDRSFQQKALVEDQTLAKLNPLDYMPESEILGEPLGDIAGRTGPTPLIQRLVNEKFDPGLKEAFRTASEAEIRRELPPGLNAEESASAIESIFKAQENEAAILKQLQTNPEARIKALQIWIDHQDAIWKAKIDKLDGQKLFDAVQKRMEEERINQAKAMIADLQLPKPGEQGAGSAPTELNKTEAFNQRKLNLINEFRDKGITLPEAEARRLALIKDNGEFNVERQRLIDAALPGGGQASRPAPIKSLENLNPAQVPPKKGAGIRSPVGLSIAEPLLGALTFKAAAQMTGQDEETEKKWMLNGFGLGILAVGGARMLARIGTKPGVIGVRAFHGTGHDISKIEGGKKVYKSDKTKIGTGEGGTAFGYPLTGVGYIAEEHKVASKYRKTNREYEFMALNREENGQIPFSLLRDVKFNLDSGQPKQRIIQNLKYWIEDLKDPNQQFLGTDQSIAAVTKLLESGDFRIKEAGNIYTVDFDATDDQLLHWDKPISGQSKAIQDAVSPFIEDMMRQEPNATGHMAYDAIAQQRGQKGGVLSGISAFKNDKLASEYLLSRGIKGIKYEDQFSRNATLFTIPDDSGGIAGWRVSGVDKTFDTREEAQAELNKVPKTHNYVVFDENALRITHENGVPIEHPEGPKPSSGRLGIMDNDPNFTGPSSQSDANALGGVHNYLPKIDSIGKFAALANQLNQKFGLDNPWSPWFLKNTPYWEKATSAEKASMDPDGVIHNAKIPEGWQYKDGKYSKIGGLGGYRLADIIPMVQNAAPAIGGIAGYLGGDTQEDKEKSALRLAGLGMAIRGVKGPAALGAMLRTGAQRQSFLRAFSRAFDKVQERTEYGNRTEATAEKSRVLAWSNGSRRWYVDRLYGEIPSGEDVKLDANQILIPRLTLKEAELMAQNLPPLPLDAFSSENNPPSPKSSRELAPGVEIPSSLDDLLRKLNKNPTISNKQAYLDRMMDRINAEFRTEEPSSGSMGIVPGGSGDNKPTKIQEAFNKVHEQQRYEGPEGMFEPANNPNVDKGTGQWTNALEHVGDLVHRSSYSGYKDFGGGGAAYGREATLNKAERFIRIFSPKRGMMPIADEVAMNIRNNYDHRVGRGEFNGTFEEFQKQVKDAGERYSQEYEKIEPVTEVQKLGRDAAIDVGRFKFDEANDKLKKLVGLLKGDDWQSNYWKPIKKESGGSGIVFNPFAGKRGQMLRTARKIDYEIHLPTEENGLSEPAIMLRATDANGKQIVSGALSAGELENILGSNVAKMLVDDAIDSTPNKNGAVRGSLVGLKPSDFTADFKQKLADIIPTLQNAAPGIGAAIGYIGGDTQEDKERSAMQLAGVGFALRGASMGMSTAGGRLAGIFGRSMRTKPVPPKKTAPTSSVSTPVRPEFADPTPENFEAEREYIVQKLRASPANKFEDRPLIVSPGVDIGRFAQVAENITNLGLRIVSASDRGGITLINRDVAADIMDGNVGYSGPLVNIFGGKIDINHNNELNYKRDFAAPILEITEGKGLNEKSMERVNIYAHDLMDRSNPDVPNTHLEDSGVTPETIEHIRKTLTPQERGFYNAARKVLDEEIFPRVAAVMKNEYGIDLTKVDNYWPTQVDARTLESKGGKPGPDPLIRPGAEAGLDDLTKSMINDFRPDTTSRTTQGITKEKVERAGGAINLKSNTLDRHISVAAHLIAHTRDLRMLGKLVRARDFAEKYGKRGQEWWEDHLDSVARDANPVGAINKVLLNGLMRNSAVGILALRFLSQAKHLSNTIIATREIGPTSLFKGMTEIFTSEGKEFLKRNMGEVYSRYGGETTIEELVHGNMWKRFQSKFFFPERAIDAVLARSTAIGAYMNELVKKGIDPSRYAELPVDNEAITQALVKSRKVVTSTLRKDASHAISRGVMNNMTISRAVFQFQQTMLKNAGYAKHEIWDLGLKKGDYGAALTAAATVVGVLASVSAITLANKHLMPSVYRDVLGINVRDKRHHPGDPSLEGEFYEEMAAEGVRQIPVVGPLLSAAIMKGETGVPVVDQTVKGLHLAGQLLTGKNEYGQRLSYREKQRIRGNALSWIGTSLGIPGASTAGQMYSQSIPTAPR